MLHFLSHFPHHVQTTQGEGWNHATSTDLVHWKTGSHGPYPIHETYAGMDSLSDPCTFMFELSTRGALSKRVLFSVSLLLGAHTC